MIHIGVVGTGSIVHGFITSTRIHPEVKFDAVYSRSEKTGRDFADANDVDLVYTDYAKMLEEAPISVVYIASPNSFHYSQAKQALLAGKHVLVEKPFTGNLETAKELVRLAQSKNLILMEAICNIHMPHFKMIQDNLDKLGTLRLVQCNYSQYSSRYDLLLKGEVTNVFNPEFSGGALADLNIYNIHFTVKLFGRPKSVHYEANTYVNGIDTSGVLVLDYGTFKAVLVAAKDSFSVNFGQIQGEKGYVYVEDGVNRMHQLKWANDTEVHVVEEQPQPRLYYQIEALVTMINNQDYTLRDELLNHSLDVVWVAEAARKQIGLDFKS